MVKTETPDQELSEIGWQIFNVPWCTGYSSKLYQRFIDLLIHEDTNDFLPHRLCPILVFDIKDNMQSKHIGRMDTRQYKNLKGLAPEQYGTRKAKKWKFKRSIPDYFRISSNKREFH